MLSFRRRRDVVWFVLSVALFSGGIGALIVTTLQWRRLTALSITPAPEPIETPPVAEPPPTMEEPAPPPEPEKPSLEEETPVVPPEPVKKAPPAGPKKPAPVAEPKGSRFDLLDAGLKFRTLMDRKARLTPAVTPGPDRTLRLDYDMADGQWVQAFVDLKQDLSKFKRVQFVFTGNGGANTFELKIVDSDGTNVGIDWPRASGRAAATVVDLPLSDLTYLWGGDPKLDWKRFRQIYFAVSEKSGDQGGRGRVVVRGIRFL
ncbi:MAG: hypothetical protein E6Q99_05965 [Elusimicrobia bacterium]|nr:MAG: hypothetical protein E6Q99_05965 [Elusimicrobiota bacterium]